MNILFTSDLAGMGGGETSLLNLSLALKDQHKIFILCAMYGKLTDKFFAENIPTFVINYRCKSLLLLNMIKIRTIVRDNKIDVIHSNDPLTSVIMHYAVYGTTVKTYWTCHGQWYDFSEINLPHTAQCFFFINLIYIHNPADSGNGICIYENADHVI